MHAGGAGVLPVLTASGVRSLGDALDRQLRGPAWVLAVSVAGVPLNVLRGLRPPVVAVTRQGRGRHRMVDLQEPAAARIRADPGLLPLASGVAPAVHCGDLAAAGGRWWPALTEMARVTAPNGVLGLALGPAGGDTLLLQAREHFLTLLGVLDPRHGRWEAAPEDLQDARQVDSRLAGLGFGDPACYPLRAELVLTARQLVGAVRGDPLVVGPACDPAAVEEAARLTLRWVGERLGGPDVPIVLVERLAYRFYPRR